jgi:hypothetical protein
LLRELQLELGRAFHEAGAAGPAARSVLGQLCGLGEVAPAETLAIYQGSVAHAVEKALRDIFPVCAALLGGDCFRALARESARRHPSTGPDLARVGDSLPALVPLLSFLDAVPYLADVASLELAWHRAWTQPDPPTAGDPARIAEAVSAEPHRHRFLLPPSLQLVASEHPILEIWQAHQEDCEALDALDLGADLPASQLVVWRRDAELRIDRVDTGLWLLLESIARGEPASALLELYAPESRNDVDELLQQDPDDFAPALEAIRSLFERGWIVGLEPVPGRAGRSDQT